MVEVSDLTGFPEVLGQGERSTPSSTPDCWPALPRSMEELSRLGQAIDLVVVNLYLRPDHRYARRHAG